MRTSRVESPAVDHSKGIVDQSKNPAETLGKLKKSTREPMGEWKGLLFGLCPSV